MPAIIEVVTAAEHQKLVDEVASLRTLCTDLLNSLNEDVDTKTALKLTGIKSCTTLINERQRPGTLLQFSKLGRRCVYSRASCLAYKRAHRFRS
ncbi:hypothetical protein [Hymenobacter lapidarius]|uniref:hypothetical protein n=1 Tax=Hymenobacter lapidarius TaxID=1908237 RepID=UPI000F7A0916|nr:hypothetical protein [Hymenobacter lapidarius]